ncbi:MAG: hypothetical protein LBI28_07265 [Treponema sp.]|jgi:hypothetical protein|nr:hypothetical protein [Treponema sp.]
MTEVLINELSLTGQFNSVDEFITGGALLKFNAILNEIKGPDVLLYKNYQFFESMTTDGISIHDILVGTISRQYDEIRKMKTSLSCLFEESYWENGQKHSPDVLYLFNNNCVTGQSIAEACERDRIVISFFHRDFSSCCLSILRENTEITLDNLSGETDYIEVARERNLITCEKYCIRKFKDTKLDFSTIDPNEGFSILKKEDEKLFIDGFRKFTELTWSQINVDNGLDYKEYNATQKYFKSYGKKIHKFRISRRYRCFGYVEQDVFHIIVFDLEHKYSDFG